MPSVFFKGSDIWYSISSHGKWSHLNKQGLCLWLNQLKANIPPGSVSPVNLLCVQFYKRRWPGADAVKSTFWAVLRETRSWTQWSLWVSSNSRYILYVIYNMICNIYLYNIYRYIFCDSLLQSLPLHVGSKYTSSGCPAFSQLPNIYQHSSLAHRSSSQQWLQPRLCIGKFQALNSWKKVVVPSSPLISSGVASENSETVFIPSPCLERDVLAPA